MKSVFTAVPIHRAWQHESQDTFIANVSAARSWKLDTLFKLYEESLIQRARNTCVGAFLKSKADYLFFLDDDIVLIQDDAVDRLIRADKDIIGGTCVVKKPPYRPNYYPLTPIYPDTRKMTQPLEIEYLGTSCMLIKRKVIERIMQETKYPFDCFENSRGVYLSEDWGFCDIARRLEFKVFIEPTVVCGHIGKYIYSLNEFYSWIEFENNGKELQK